MSVRTERGVGESDGDRRQNVVEYRMVGLAGRQWFSSGRAHESVRAVYSCRPPWRRGHAVAGGSPRALAPVRVLAPPCA